MHSTDSRQRKIIHVDADSFYASVEMRDNPELRDVPLAVGGRPDRRGVIATSNYKAREYGVRSAMASSRAMKLCPQLRIVPARFDHYRAISRQMRSIFANYTPLIEPLSLDEAYLDVSECTQCQGSATLIAEEIRTRIKSDLGLTVSAGVAPNKFLAKVASDWDKPDGCFTVAPAEIAEFVRTLPVARINGVGKVTARKLKEIGAETCGELQEIPLETLVRRFGKYGSRLAELARGIDNREVKPSRLRKSISVEHTYPADLEQQSDLLDALGKLLEELDTRFEAINTQYRPWKRFVKVKFQDFTQTTLEEVIAGNPADWLDADIFSQLLVGARQRSPLPVRLLGAGLRLEPSIDQLSEPQPDLFTG